MACQLCSHSTAQLPAQSGRGCTKRGLRAACTGRAGLSTTAPPRRAAAGVVLARPPSRRTLAPAAALPGSDGKPGLDRNNLPGSKPDVWESELIGGAFKVGYPLVLVAAFATLLLLAWPVVQTAVNSFPKA